MRRAGYTLIELMTAVVILAIGASGILAMQGATTRANQDAYESSVATNFAMTWLERLKRDARLWTATGNAALANTQYLNAGPLNLDGATNSARGDPSFPQYFVPPPMMNGTTMVESPGADYYGFETAIAANIYYCVNVSRILAHATGTPAARAIGASALEVAVMVWWYRRSFDTDRTLVNNGCLANALTNAQLADPRIRTQVYSTIVTWRAAGWP